MPPLMSERFEHALAFAAEAHRTQRRKGSGVPYVGHLLGVCSLVLEEGCDEDTAVAALLHDAVEDQSEHRPILEEIRESFGDRAARMVLACTDTDEHPKPPWRPRKEAYIRRLEVEPLDLLEVPLADKLFNARAIRRDLEQVGERLWCRFTVGRGEVLWYYRSVSNVFSRRLPTCPMSQELADVVQDLEPVVAENDTLHLWLDDDVVDRAAPAGWVQVTTAWEAIELLDTGRVVERSLDHDLGDDERFGRGVDVVDWLAEQQEVHERALWPRDGITIHSANPAGRDAMARAVENYAGRACTVHRELTSGGKPRLTFS